MMQYPCIESFFTTHHMPVPKLGDWRLLDPPQLGEVNALPMSRGFAMVTDGIICYIERTDGSLYLGHFTAWIADKREEITLTRSGERISLPECFADF